MGKQEAAENGDFFPPPSSGQAFYEAVRQIATSA